MRQARPWTFCYLCLDLGDLYACPGECGRFVHADCANIDESDPEWMCDYCSAGVEECFVCHQKAKKPSLLPCGFTGCNKFYHRACVNLEPDYDHSKVTRKWKCQHHVCSECERPPTAPGGIISCILCARGIHRNCIIPDREEDYGEIGNFYLCYKHPKEISELKEKRETENVQKNVFAAAENRDHLQKPDPESFFGMLLEDLPPADDFRLPYKLYELGGDGRKPSPFTRVLRNVYPPGMRPKITKDDIMECSCQPTDPIPCDPGTCQNAATYFECLPSTCINKKSCHNMRLQRRQYPQLKLFKTDSCGFGIKAAEEIKAGQLVQEYMGEVLPIDDYYERIASYKEDTPVYFFTLDSNFVIDASIYGSMARFINHSCSPNCHTEKWTVGGEIRIGIFATVDIPKGTEITYNYQFESFGDHKHICRCGAPNCSGFMGQRPKKAGNNESDDEDDDDRKKKGGKGKGNEKKQEKRGRKKSIGGGGGSASAAAAASVEAVVAAIKAAKTQQRKSSPSPSPSKTISSSQQQQQQKKQQQGNKKVDDSDDEDDNPYSRKANYNQRNRRASSDQNPAETPKKKGEEEKKNDSNNHKRRGAAPPEAENRVEKRGRRSISSSSTTTAAEENKKGKAGDSKKKSIEDDGQSSPVDVGSSQELIPSQSSVRSRRNSEASSAPPSIVSPTKKKQGKAAAAAAAEPTLSQQSNASSASSSARKRRGQQQAEEEVAIPTSQQSQRSASSSASSSAKKQRNETPKKGNDESTETRRSSSRFASKK